MYSVSRNVHVSTYSMSKTQELRWKNWKDCSSSYTPTTHPSPPRTSTRAHARTVTCGLTLQAALLVYTVAVNVRSGRGFCWPWPQQGNRDVRRCRTHGLAELWVQRAGRIDAQPRVQQSDGPGGASRVQRIAGGVDRRHVDQCTTTRRDFNPTPVSCRPATAIDSKLGVN